MISGRGSSTPKVMLIADSAQNVDLQSGYALSGYQEEYIKGFARRANIQFESLYLTALIKDEAPKISWKGKKKPSESEICRERLKEIDPRWPRILLDEISTLKPNLLVPLGELGFQFLSQFEGIRKFRGSVLKVNPIHQIVKYTKLLPILGPFPYLNQDYKLKFISQVDFLKIPKWSGEQEIPDDTYRVWVAKSAAEVRNFFNRSYETCKNKTIEEGGFLVFDIETYMNVPTCISFCFDGFESCCIPFLDVSIDRDNRVLMVDLIFRLLASPLPKVNQNIKYDWKTLERWGFGVGNVVGDTMLAASTIYCEFPKNLGFLTSIYTDLPYFKDEGRMFDPARHKKEQFYLYNAKDSLATHQIYSKQIPEIKELGTNYVYESLIKLMPIYRRAEDRGLRVDAERRDKLLAKYTSLYRIHKLTLCRLANQDNLNPLSAPAMQDLIFEELGYQRIRGVAGGDEESIQMLMAKGKPEYATMDTGRAILQEIIWCRKIHKVIEILELPLYPDGRFRGEFNLAGTETGRTSSSKTSDYHIDAKETSKGQKVKIKNIGHSLQTIGKHGFYIGDELYGEDVRDYFVPSPGYRFVEIDLAGAEARVDRVLSGNFDLTVFDSPGIHKYTGSLVFGVDANEIVKGSLRYHLAKTVRHAGERNMQADRYYSMAQDAGLGLSLTLAEADAQLRKFHAAEPQIRSVFHKSVHAAITGPNRCLVAPNGRRRDFFDRPTDQHTINEGISFLPQAVVSDKTKFSFIPTFHEADWAYLLVEAHDGSLSEVPIGRESEFGGVYKRNVETGIDFRQGTLKRDFELTIPAEVSIGESWGTLEEIKL